MADFQITPATVILGIIIAILLMVAIRRLMRRGTCDCKDCGPDGTGGCASCGAVDKMIADMEQASHQDK